MASIRSARHRPIFLLPMLLACIHTFRVMLPEDGHPAGQWLLRAGAAAAVATGWRLHALSRREWSAGIERKMLLLLWIASGTTLVVHFLGGGRRVEVAILVAATAMLAYGALEGSGSAGAGIS